MVIRWWHWLDSLLSLLRLLWVVFTVRAASFVSPTPNVLLYSCLYLGNKPSVVSLPLICFTYTFANAHTFTDMPTRALQFSSSACTLSSWCFYARRLALLSMPGYKRYAGYQREGGKQPSKLRGVVKRSALHFASRLGENPFPLGGALKKMSFAFAPR